MNFGNKIISFKWNHHDMFTTYDQNKSFEYLKTIQVFPCFRSNVRFFYYTIWLKSMKDGRCRCSISHSLLFCCVQYSLNMNFTIFSVDSRKYEKDPSLNSLTWACTQPKMKRWSNNGYKREVSIIYTQRPNVCNIQLWDTN